LIFENNYDEVNNGVSKNIYNKRISSFGANLIAIAEPENYFSYFELDRHYHKFMTGNWNA
jgi:hypothetical protein